MTVVSSPTPNPNALKFTVGTPVGAAATFTADNPGDDPLGAELLAIAGVVSAFMTADFVTITKSAEADWSTIEPPVTEALNRRFGSDA